jgi:hypothetical protein
MLMCLIFTLLAGIGFWIHSQQPCDKTMPSVEEKALEKLKNMGPSTPNWLQTLLNKIKFWWNSEDIDDLKDKDLLKDQNNSVPNISELDNKDSPIAKLKPDYNSKVDRSNTPVKSRSLSLGHLPSYDAKKSGSSSPIRDSKFGTSSPTRPDDKSISVNSLHSVQGNEPKSAARPSTKPSTTKVAPILSMNDSLTSAEIGQWYLDSPKTRKKPGQASSGNDKKPNCRREIIITAVSSTLITIAVFAGLYALFPDFFSKIFH